MPAERRRPSPPLLLLLLLWCCCSPPTVWTATLGRDAGPVSATPPSVSEDNAGGVAATHPESESHQRRRPEVQFTLKALVRDLTTRRPLGGAVLDVYADRTLRASARTGPGGEALLQLPSGPRLRLTLLARMEGYVPATLPWSTAKRPLFSAVTLRLLPQSHGNIWLFEDSLIITAKLPDSSSQPSVKFPKDLLMLAENASVSSLSAFLTVPRHHLATDCSTCTPAIIASNQSAYRTVELRPAAALSVRLYSGTEELRVRGPVHLSLPLGAGAGLQPADTLPAWAFDSQTGAWQHQGLGIVRLIDGHLVWTYTASHLGYWIAAPLPTDHKALAGSADLLSDHNLLLAGLFGATLAVVMGFVAVLVCHCGRSQRAPRRRKRRAPFSKPTVLKKDQTTSTHAEEEEEEGLPLRPARGTRCDPSTAPGSTARYNIYVEDPGTRSAALLYQNLDRNKGPHVTSEHKKPNLFFQDKLIHVYNRPAAGVRAPELFGSQECPGSAAFPHTGGEYRPGSDPARKGGVPQTPPRGDPRRHSRSADDPRQPGQPLETPPRGVQGRYSSNRNPLESSVSVPAGTGPFGGAHGALGELQGELELSSGGSSEASAAPPRAWFVSLEGKPAARVRHSIIELQSHQQLPSSNDTSMDSGVDMNEPRPSGRRDRRAARASSLPHRTRGRCSSEEPDLSSSESGTAAACTPEDSSLRSVPDGILEERDGPDTSSAQEDSGSRETPTPTPPPPRRVRKVREKGKTTRRRGALSAGHGRLTKPS